MGNIIYIPKHVSVKFGMLYNLYSFENVKELTSSDLWTLPTSAQITAFINYVGANGGIKICEANAFYWTNWDTNTNSLGFWGRGSGTRGHTGSFSQLYTHQNIWGKEIAYDDYIRAFGITGVSKVIAVQNVFRRQGLSMRFVRTSPSVSDGSYGTYSGNNGQEYRTIGINGVEWMADNLAETKYRDHSQIPEITDTDAWVADVSGAFCYYNNNPSYR